MRVIGVNREPPRLVRCTLCQAGWTDAGHRHNLIRKRNRCKLIGLEHRRDGADIVLRLRSFANLSSGAVDTSSVSCPRRVSLIDAPRPPVASCRPLYRACVKGIDETLGGETRCGLSALRQGGKAAVDIFTTEHLDLLEADRIVRIVRLRA